MLIKLSPIKAPGKHFIRWRTTKKDEPCSPSHQSCAGKLPRMASLRSPAINMERYISGTLMPPYWQLSGYCRIWLLPPGPGRHHLEQLGAGRLCLLHHFDQNLINLFEGWRSCYRDHRDHHHLHHLLEVSIRVNLLIVCLKHILSRCNCFQKASMLVENGIKTSFQITFWKSFLDI